MSENASERRRHRRLRVSDGAFVCLGSPERKLWHILDVSLGGLSFRYMENALTPRDSSDMEIVSRDTSFSLDNLHFRVVSDTALRREPGSPAHLRRCGVEFMPTTNPQSAQLELFMGRYCS